MSAVVEEPGRHQTNTISSKPRSRASEEGHERRLRLFRARVSVRNFRKETNAFQEKVGAYETKIGEPEARIEERKRTIKNAFHTMIGMKMVSFGANSYLLCNRKHDNWDTSMPMPAVAAN